MIKKLIIRFLSKIGCLLLKLRGVRTGTGVILSGLPRIKKFPGACITIGNGADESGAFPPCLPGGPFQ